MKTKSTPANTSAIKLRIPNPYNASIVYQLNPEKPVKYNRLKKKKQQLSQNKQMKSLSLQKNASNEGTGSVHQAIEPAKNLKNRAEGGVATRREPAFPQHK